MDRDRNIMKSAAYGDLFWWLQVYLPTCKKVRKKWKHDYIFIARKEITCI